jgi:hypothetical protein
MEKENTHRENGEGAGEYETYREDEDGMRYYRAEWSGKWVPFPLSIEDNVAIGALGTAFSAALMSKFNNPSSSGFEDPLKGILMTELKKRYVEFGGTLDPLEHLRNIEKYSGLLRAFRNIYNNDAGKSFELLRMLRDRHDKKMNHS